jgi:hypothetical protein
MNAQRFHGEADGEDCIVDRADDGTLLPELDGWECGACATLYADRSAAELCCVGPDAVAGVGPG